jgi:hypothetical protein
MNKRKISILGISLLISILVMPLRGIMLCNNIPGVTLSSLLGFILYFFFSILCLKKYIKIFSSKNILIVILLGICIFQLPMRIIDFNETLISLPDFLLHILGILGGYFAFNRPFRTKCCVFSAGLIVCLLMFFKGYEYWNHKMLFGTFTGKIEVVETPDFQFTDENGTTFSKNDFIGKYPTVILFDREGNAIFRGNIETASDYIDRLLKKQLL